MATGKNIFNNVPARYVQQKSRKWYLPGFEGLSFYDVVTFFRSHAKWQNLNERAAAISYNFIMSVPPSLLFMFTIVPHLPFIKTRILKHELHIIIYDIIPSKVYNQHVIKFVDNFIDESRFGLMSFGLLLALWFASNAMFGLMRAFNKEYLGFLRQKGLESRWVAIKLTLILFGLAFGYILLLIAQGQFLSWAVKSQQWKNIITYSRWLLMVAMLFVSIGIIFKYAPSVKVRWKFISPGSVLATILCVVSSVVFSMFVNNFGRYNALYGTLGTIMMVMALIFINSLALLIGFELNVSIKSLKEMNAIKAAEKDKQNPEKSSMPSSGYLNK